LGTRTHPLDPIADLQALGELYCGFNKISSLEPLRHSKNLQYLDCSSNTIQSLEPLKDLELYSLDCSGNKIITLDPYVESKNPPTEFTFDDDTLPDAELERAKSAWSAKRLHFDVTYCELLLALRHSFRATGITNFLENGGTLEVAQRIAGNADSRTTKLYDRRGQTVLVEDMERIRY
jgi:hypothetical protein